MRTNVSKLPLQFPSKFPCADLSPEKDAIKIIAISDSQGSELSINKCQILESYCAFKKLLDFGFRTSTVDFGIDLLHKADHYQQYSVCQDICTSMAYHYSLVKDMQNVLKYDQLRNKYSELLDLEYKSLMIYSKILHSNQTGVEIDSRSLVSNLCNLETILPKGSFIFAYFKYQVYSEVYEGEELESMLIEAIDYFTDLYFNHEKFVSIFTDELISYYKDLGQTEKSMSLLNSQIDKIEFQSPIWFRFQFMKAQLSDSSDAILICYRVKSLCRYSELTEDRHTEWDALQLYLSKLYVA